MQGPDPVLAPSPRSTPSPSSPKGGLRGLVALNLVLLLALGAVTLGATVHAQGRGRGEYTMVAGGVNGTNNSAGVYVVDVANQEMIAVAYNQTTKKIEGIGYRNLAADARSVTRPNARPNN